MGIFSGAANIASTAMTNEANYSIAKMNNETQIELWEQQLQHDLDMWNMENRYNDPKQQVSRLLAAGINPLMMDKNAGNAIGNAGGQTPPSLTTPTLQAPQFDFGDTLPALSQAYKNIADADKSKSETVSTDYFNEQTHEMMLKGYNPEMLKAQYLLQQYTNLKKEGKYITPFMEKQIAKLDSDIDYNKENIKVRRAEVQRVRQETRGIKMMNNFNADMFPQQLAKIQEEIESVKQSRENEKKLVAAQANALGAQAALAEEQKGLVSKQATEQDYKNDQAEFKARLAKYGINCEDKNLPFFTGMAAALADGKIKPQKVTEFFRLLSDAEKYGWNQLVDGKADLTKFQLYDNNTIMDLRNRVGSSSSPSFFGKPLFRRTQ